MLWLQTRESAVAPTRPCLRLYVSQVGRSRSWDPLSVRAGSMVRHRLAETVSEAAEKIPSRRAGRRACRCYGLGSRDALRKKAGQRHDETGTAAMRCWKEASDTDGLMRSPARAAKVHLGLPWRSRRLSPEDDLQMADHRTRGKPRGLSRRSEAGKKRLLRASARQGSGREGGTKDASSQNCDLQRAAWHRVGQQEKKALPTCGQGSSHARSPCCLCSKVAPDSVSVVGAWTRWGTQTLAFSCSPRDRRC
jgi:hypothetical protein